MRRDTTGAMRAVARPAFEPHQAEAGYELPLDVEITDSMGEAVFRVRRAMWISPRPPH